MKNGDSTSIKLLFDNQGIVELLKCGRTNFSLQGVKKFKELCSTYPAIVMHWIPGCSSIHGNEKFDMLAKRALATDTRD